MSESRRRALLIGGIPLGLLMLLCAAWGIDTAVSGDRVARNVEVAGIPLGGLDSDEVAAVAADLNAELAVEPVSVTIGTDTVASTAGDLGAIVDSDTLVDEALDARSGGFILIQPFLWASSLFSTVTLDVPYSVDSAVAEAASDTLIATMLSEPIEPQFEVTETSIQVVPGADGATLADGAVEAELLVMLEGDTPYTITLDPIPLRPETDTTELDQVAAEASAATDSARTFEVLTSTAIAEPPQLRSWVTLVGLEEGNPDWIIDPTRSLADIQAMFPELGSADQLARFDVVNGVPVIIPPSSSVVCCETDSPDIIKAGLIAGDDPITLQPAASGGEEAVAALEALGIVEEVSTFTTKHNCCENRVTNIQTMADIVKGHVVKPGEQFSLNGFVGERTLAGGFLPAGAIADGVIEAQVGGGVSQFTTTIFNAVFFAGLEFDEYQSHSIYFSRYPYGREATVSFPKPDFKFTNDTPYGVLIWPTYTDNSITVTFYSTRHIKSEDLGHSESKQGECTRVTTTRQRTWDDGTVKKDSVFAVYRPGEGLDCNGNSTKPTTTTTTPEETTTSEDDAATTAPTTEATVPEETTPEATTTTQAETTPTSEG